MMRDTMKTRTLWSMTPMVTLAQYAGLRFLAMNSHHLNLTQRRKLTYDDARSMLQASELELALGLRDRHILILDGM